MDVSLWITCPPSFYGDQFQYESQRVIVTIKIYAGKRLGIQLFFVRLVSDDEQGEEQVHRHHQFNYVLKSSCSKTFKILLLFANQPKNDAVDYYVKIDVFDQTSFAHLASWPYRVPFVFLPINPVNIVIRVPAEPISPSKTCGSLACGRHGRCVKYLNEESFFCRCETGWSGKICDQPVVNGDGGSASWYVGRYENRSICLCPTNTFGCLCLLKRSCEEGLCDNGGQCVLPDENHVQSLYRCLCTEKFYDTFCHHPFHSIELFFEKHRYIVLSNHFHLLHDND